VYAPGELRVVAYKNGKRWAQDLVRTTGAPAALTLTAESEAAAPTKNDLVFVTAQVTDKQGAVVPEAKQTIRFSLEGPGEIVATDNGDAANMVSFASPERAAFNGRCLVIIRRKKGQTGTIKLQAQSNGLTTATLALRNINGN
jgi:beta-galactosidase